MIMGILVFLMVIMLIQRAIKCKKQGKPFFNSRIITSLWPIGKSQAARFIVAPVAVHPGYELYGFLPARLFSFSCSMSCLSALPSLLPFPGFQDQEILVEP
jgi:hypothetical protein